jgi:hypothetical protein
MDEKKMLKPGFGVVSGYKGAWDTGKASSPGSNELPSVDGVLVIVEEGCEYAHDSFHHTLCLAMNGVR